MSHLEPSYIKDKSFSHDFREMEEKKSEIFSLPFHENRVKKIYPSQNRAKTD
jgi:hypothetical protein